MVILTPDNYSKNALTSGLQLKFSNNKVLTMKNTSWENIKIKYNQNGNLENYLPKKLIIEAGLMISSTGGDFKAIELKDTKIFIAGNKFVDKIVTEMVEKSLN